MESVSCLQPKMTKVIPVHMYDLDFQGWQVFPEVVNTGGIYRYLPSWEKPLKVGKTGKNWEKLKGWENIL